MLLLHRPGRRTVRNRIFPARPHLAVLLLGLMFAAHLGTAAAQFKLQQSFMGTTAPGWTLTGNALLTAPAIDPVGQGWLRLTDTGGYEKGVALDTGQTLSAVPVTVRFNYVSWGGSGADGITVYLYDSTQDMSGAQVGGGLGYCGGAGGYLAIGLDEYGNFSNPGDRCGAASGGPGWIPESLVIRGPLSANDQYVTGVQVPGGIDNPGVASRPSPKTVIITMTPATLGYTVTALFQSASGQPFQTLFSNVAFPYVAPASLSIGISGSTGGSTNTHELQGLVAATPDDLQVVMTGPATVLEGTPVSYTLTVTNNGAYPIDAPDAPTVTDPLPAQLSNVTWSCAGAGGASCTASGAGNLNTAGLTLPSNASVTYTITGTLDPGTVCGSTLDNTANADFGSTSTFIDPDPGNNSATVSSTVSCAVTLLANPGALPFAPQTVGVPSMAQTVTVVGTNGATISNVTTTGPYSATSNCGAPLTGTSCTIQVVFAPQSEGSQNGTLVITSSATGSPTIVTLSGTGTDGVPSPFGFSPLTGVDPGSVQVSNAITVTGTNVPTTISVSAGAAYSINGGPYSTAPGVVSPGARVTLRLTASGAYATAVSAELTIGGMTAPWSVTTRSQPQLQDVVVTSGGGSSSPLMLLVLAAVLLLRRRRAVQSGITGLLLCTALLASAPGSADDWNGFLSNLYVGGGLGEVTTTLTPAQITSRLQQDGYQVSASEVARTSLFGSLSVGYELPRGLGIEAGWSYLGRTRTQLQGVAPPNLEQLLYDASRVTRGGGDAWSLVGRYRWNLQPRWSLDLRAGPYYWVTHSDLWIGGIEQLNRNDRGWGYVVGAGPRYSLSERCGVALNGNYFVSTTDNRFIEFGLSIDYRLP